MGSKYCEHCKQKTPVMYYEGSEYCMYCQDEYKEERKEDERKTDNEEYCVSEGAINTALDRR